MLETDHRRAECCILSLLRYYAFSIELCVPNDAFRNVCHTLPLLVVFTDIVPFEDTIAVKLPLDYIAEFTQHIQRCIV